MTFSSGVVDIFSQEVGFFREVLKFSSNVVSVVISYFQGSGGDKNFSGRFFHDGFQIVSGWVEMFSEVSEIFSGRVRFFPCC